MPASALLGQTLKSFPREKKYRYTEDAQKDFVNALFYSLADGKEGYLRLFFPHGVPAADQDWKLSEAQGAIDGAEYAEAARGKRCGHIFKHEEATYFCRTCTTDATCVLCQKCFEASNHEGHHVEVHLSEGSSGCCDCGDEEAWNRPLKCGIHTPLEELHGDNLTSAPHDQKAKGSQLPIELQESIRLTIGRAFDYMCDVFSCAPEHMRASKHEQSILRDEELARLVADWYGTAGEPEHCNEYALILWNDEKHTVDEVREQVARACRKRKSFGEQKAREIDAVGRAVIEFSKDLPGLIKKARILEQIKVTVTIRSSRDYFREQMCDTIVEWLVDISCCSVGTDHNILMDAVCSEMLREWRIGSNASNLSIGKQGFTDHARSDNRLVRMRERHLHNRMMAARQDARQTRLDIQLIVNNPERVETIDIVQRPDTDDNEDHEDDDDDDDMGNMEMNLDEALAQDPEEGEIDGAGVTIDTTQHAIVMNTGEIIAAPPPRPPSSPSEHSDADVSMLSPQNDPDELLSRTAMSTSSAGTESTPGYWLASGKRIAGSNDKETVLPEEDFDKRVRIDFLILYDLRMWKTLRNNLRRLYIGTVIKVPHFKRILGLRFAAIYKVLAQLYLVADREPDHSIINLSLQMLTTPSITAEIIDRGNFFTRLLAILYTFLTKRRVSSPEDVDLTSRITFETGATTNRRIHHFFQDLKYLLEARYAQERIRVDEEYLLQFLDLVKLFQGIDPNTRAVGEHVQYESEAWISMILLVRDVARNIRLFAESFAWRKTQDPASMCRALRQIAKTTTIHSLGAESQRFHESDVRRTLRFKVVQPCRFEMCTEGYRASPHPVVDFVIENEAMSFHHPLHWAMSWVIDEGKSMSREQLDSLLRFDQQKLQMKDPKSSYIPQIQSLEPLQYLLALFDVPLRTCAWLAQLKAGMWIRNGFTLRQQMSTFHNFIQREITSQRDIFLLQVALVVCPPETLLAAIIDRFGMSGWVNGNLDITQGWEDHQQLDVAEEFVHLLVVLLSDRTLLRPIEEEPEPVLTIAKREIIHALCFKPLTYSDLADRMTHTTTSMPNFNQTLFQVARYKAPEGLSDTGSFELRDEMHSGIDPYNYYYSKNQREESENAWRRHEAKKHGTSVDDVVYEPQLRKIQSGLFVDLGKFTQTPIFSQVVWGLLHITIHPKSIGQLPSTKIEAFLPSVLHLMLVAIAEGPPRSTGPASSFVDSVVQTNVGDSVEERTILHQLFTLRHMSDVHEASRSKLRRVLYRLQEKRRSAVEGVASELGVPVDDSEAHASKEMAARELAEKKRKAQERNARVMASFKKQQSDFMSNQMDEFDLDEWSDLGSDVEMGDDHVKKIWNFPRDTCIYCQEETDEEQLYGSLAFITKSKIFRDTDLQNRDHIREVGMTPLTYDQELEGLRPFGMARQNIEQVLRVSENGEAVTHERRGLGKGWSPSQNALGNVATGCGHLMHYSCFETFNAATERRQTFQIARNHPERLLLKEFVCPLCKALGNAFLPIIFKPKELSNPLELSGSDFDEWLHTQVPFLVSEARARDDEIYLQEGDDYQANAVLPGYALSSTSDVNHNPGRLHLAMPSFLGDTSSAPSSSRDNRGLHATDPSAAYKRLKDTMKKNNLDPFSSRKDGSAFSPSDILAGTLGSSISATEIGLRGQECGDDTHLFLNKVPHQTITHLRILSETCSACASYLPMGGSVAAKTSTLNQRTQLFGAVLESTGLDEEREDLELRLIPALLYEDIFEFFARSTVFLVPFLKLAKLQHLLRLCLLAEMTKVVVACLENFTTIEAYAYESVSARTDSFGEDVESSKLRNTQQQSESFSAFIQSIVNMLEQPLSQSLTEAEFLTDEIRNPNSRPRFDHFVHAIVQSYILPFLRKCLLLLYVRTGIDFSAVSGLDSQSPEIDRLTHVLGLPSIDELIGDCLSSSPLSYKLQQLMNHWISHWRVHRYKPARTPPKSQRSTVINHQNDILRGIFSPNQGGSFADTALSIPTPPGAYIDDTSSRPSSAQSAAPEQVRPLRLPHPGVYELVALPQTHDILNAESLARRCPKTKGPLTDPCLCLFCGEVFCGQAQCCSIEAPLGSGNTQGGCFLHQRNCAGSIGMFFNIRKNVILFLNGANGCFMQAPYLDEHGESDMGLKRKGRLFLERKRYDRLFREVWLAHGVPSAVSRKLEGEVNTGGWETL